MHQADGGNPALSVRIESASAGAAGDLSGGIELLNATRNPGANPVLRLYRPQPTVAFGQRDAKRDGFVEAQRLCLEHGFEPLVRKAGGSAAAYHSGCLIIDHVEPDLDAIIGSKQRFRYFGQLLAGALRSVGVDAGVGEIAGEYCPGEFSVHGGGGNDQIKLVGTAQRVVAGAWLFSSVIVVCDSAPLRSVLTDVYAALGRTWDPRTAGAAEDLVPGLTVDAVSAAVLAAYAQYVPGSLSDAPTR